MRLNISRFETVFLLLLMAFCAGCASQEVSCIRYLGDGGEFRKVILEEIDSEEGCKLSNTKSISVFRHDIFLTQCDSVNAVIAVKSGLQNRLLWAREMSILRDGVAVFSSGSGAYILSVPYKIQVPGSDVWVDDQRGTEPWVGDKLFFKS